MARKHYDERTFDITDKIQISCWTENTSYGFRHLAVLYLNYINTDDDKACYYNRTWERFTYQSVMERLCEKTKYLSQEEKEYCKNWLEEGKEGVKKDMAGLGMIGAIASLGGLFCESKKLSASLPRESVWEPNSIVIFGLSFRVSTNLSSDTIDSGRKSHLAKS